MIAEPLQFTRTAYQARQTAIRWSLVAAHLGLRPFIRPKAPPSPRALLALRRRLDQLLERDFANAQSGLYPRELLFQMPVAEYVLQLPGLAAEVVRMLRRAKHGRVRDLPAAVDLSDFPDYFRRNFHWQTDGYLSRRSADLYDVGVEFLFLGTADVMRRQVIPPLTRFFRESPGKKRVLDVGCGTGRTLMQLGTAHPDHKYFGVDLSPYYVDRARRLLAGRDVSLLVDNAELLPLKDASFDAVVSVFLFHELPTRARRNVLREMRRVLVPGGLLVLEDSAQLVDSPELSVFLTNFGNEMNEPFFASYLREDLEAELATSGFRLESGEQAFLSKVLIARAA